MAEGENFFLRWRWAVKHRRKRGSSGRTSELLLVGLQGITTRVVELFLE